MCDLIFSTHTTSQGACPAIDKLLFLQQFQTAHQTTYTDSATTAFYEVQL